MIAELPKDAEIVVRLRDAGAVLMAKLAAGFFARAVVLALKASGTDSVAKPIASIA